MVFSLWLQIREYTYNKKGDIQTIKKKPFLEPDQELWYEYTYDKQGNYLQSKRYLRLIRTGKEVLSEIEKREITYY